jgi:hypothetical protein
MDPRRYTFVTVGYRGETGLLLLQARSMRLYCPAHLVEEIIVVDNSQPAASNRWRAEVLHHYGRLAKLVRFIPAAQLATMPAEAGGWVDAASSEDQSRGSHSIRALRLARCEEPPHQRARA